MLSKAVPRDTPFLKEGKPTRFESQ